MENCTKEQLETLIDRKAVPENPAVFQHLLSLGLECVKKIPKQRPKMEKVLEELEAVASRQQIHDQVQCMWISEIIIIIISPSARVSVSQIYYRVNVLE